VTQFFASLVLPAPGPKASFELAGGILLALGSFSRVAALGIAVECGES
jgi:uncharacterized membrane protein YphA (DoxX/SURF4 family)